MKITVYHGATEEIKSPVAGAGRPNLDFGRGFYVTDIRQQAVDWAKRVAGRRRKTVALNVYSLDRDNVISTFRCKVFEYYDGEWLDFHSNNQICLINQQIIDQYLEYDRTEYIY